MATFLDIGLLQKFELVFPFLFVLVVVWGILSYSKFLGDNKTLHSILALLFAVVVLFSAQARAVINAISPWFVIIFIFVIFILISIKMFGISDDSITAGLKGDYQWVLWTIGIIGALVLIISVIDVNFWREDTSTVDSIEEGDIGENGGGAILATLRNPNVLGLILLLLIATFAIQKLTIQT